MSIADRHTDYVWQACEEPELAGLRVELDGRSESVGKKVREAELRKLPFMLVVGDEEESSGRVAVRRHRRGDLGTVPVGEFARTGLEELQERR